MDGSECRLTLYDRVVGAGSTDGSALADTLEALAPDDRDLSDNMGTSSGTHGSPRPPDAHHRPYARLLAGAVAAATVTAITWTLANRATVPPAEERMFRLINDAPTALWPVLWPVMQLGNLAAPATIAVIVAVAKRRRRLVVAVLLSGYGAWAASTLVKDLVGRDRPGLLLDDVVLREGAEGLGFVSGHAAVAAAMATALWPYLGTRGRIVAVGLAALVGVGRIHAGAHLPLDVVGGQALGVLIGLGITAVVGVPLLTTSTTV